jgi:hypothetical protein
VIFLHRVAVRRRHFMVSALLPYGYILTLGVGLLLVTLVAGGLQAMGDESVELFGREWSLSGFSRLLLYLLGFVGEVLLLASVYLVMPVGRLALRHALIGGGDGRIAVGADTPLARVVLQYAVAGERGVRLVDHGDRRAARPGSRCGTVAVGRAGDLRIRTHRTWPRTGLPKPLRTG